MSRKPLALAMGSIRAFEEFIKKDYLKQRIVVSWLDSRRKRVYAHYLKKEGYKLIIHYGREFLIKDI